MTDKTDYTKKPLTLTEQVARLKQRGLVFDDESEAFSYLFNISYYRLRAYTYPFQENGEDSEHNFTHKDVHFKDIIDLYCFDRRLRSLIFNAIEKIEVAVRTKIVQVYAESTGDSHLENWLHAISNLRNCCAHHSRVWNRRFMVSVTLPYNTLYPFIDRTAIGKIRTNKLFAALSCVAYILDIISPGSDFKKNIKELLESDCRLLDIKDMGFPKFWQSLFVWYEE